MAPRATPPQTNAALGRPATREQRTPDVATTAELGAQLAAAREQQAATGEILRLMARSPGNVQPGLDAVAAWATRLCEAPFALVFLVVGDALRGVAHHSAAGEAAIP